MAKTDVFVKTISGTTYRLGSLLATRVSSSNFRRLPNGAFTARGEVGRVLNRLYAGWGIVSLRVFSGPFLVQDFTAVKNTTGSAAGGVSFGCNIFNAKETKKLAKWAGITI